MKPDHLPAGDHRVIGRAMNLFAGHPSVGAGLPLWLPAGAIVRRELEQYAHEVALADGCQAVYSPVLARKELFERSGHWAKFNADMFPPMQVGGDQLLLRPANCPHHAMIYAAEQHSYRDLPLRYNELAPMFRSERSGVLSGLSRVRQIDLDDTHVFCRPDQVAAEAGRAVRSVLNAFQVLGLQISRLRLSCRDGSDGYLGSDADWESAQGQLRQLLTGLRPQHPDLLVEEAAGEAAFYGPKIDVQVLDVRGHEETLATVQLDFNQPRRFDLGYIDADGRRQPVIMIHRGVIGAMERMIAFLLEVHDGRLPLWLAPVQLALQPVGPQQRAAVEDIAMQARRSGVRVRVDVDGTLGRRIRLCRQRRDALIGVIGDSEAAAGRVDVLDPRTGDRNSWSAPDLIAAIAAAISRHDREIGRPVAPTASSRPGRR